MFQKPKIFLPLLIVLSIMTGLFAFSHTAYAACPEGQTCATWGFQNGPSRNTITYNVDGDDGSYDKLTATSPMIKGGDYDCIFNDDWFKKRDNVYLRHFRNSNNTYNTSIIFFDDSVDGDEAKMAATSVNLITDFKYSDAGIICGPGTAKRIPFDSGQTTAPDDEDFEDDEEPAAGAGDTDNETEDNSNCKIDGIGWLVCPVVKFISEIIDKSYSVISGTFLRVEPLALPGGDDTSANNQKMQLYNSWKIMRDFANVIFIIAFLIIVFSQLTSIGVGNYGIKRLLPKIIIAAILVNLSYYISAVAVDISNILGSALKEMFDTVRNTIGQESAQDTQQRFKLDGQEVIGWVGLVDFVLASVLIYAFLPVLLPLLLGALMAIITVVIALTLRQALIVILIVISPLAFVALLLPNTEDYFKKWKSIFIAMLMVYPIISLVFGASALASTIIMVSSDSPLVQMVGAAVSIIPLFITPIIMKASGGLLNRWVGIVNDPSKGWIDEKRNALKDRGKIMAAGRVERTGRWVNGTGGGVFGGAGSWRRRAATSLTRYGANNRDRARKDDVNQADNTLESTYLESAKGQQARNAAKNAEVVLHDAQINAETIRLSSPVGMELQQHTMQAEMRKQTAENRAQTAALSAIPAALATETKESELEKQVAENTSKSAGLAGANTDLKIRAESSAERLSTLGNMDKQAYEELAAAGSSNATLLATHGVSAATAVAAQESRFEKKAVDSATSNAAYEGELAYATQIRNEAEARRTGAGPSPLLDQAGGNINPTTGRARAEDRAISVRDKASDVEVTNAKARIEDGDPTETIDRARQALVAANAAGDVVGARAAARVLLEKGSAGNSALDKEIIAIEGAGAEHGAVFESLRSELAGRKDSNSARDRWATGGGSLAVRQAEVESISRLNEQELAGQQMHVLQEALRAGTLAANEDLVRRVLAQNANGTIKLDTDKRNLFERALPPTPTPPPPADPSMRSGSV